MLSAGRRVSHTLPDIEIVHTGGPLQSDREGLCAYNTEAISLNTSSDPFASANQASSSSAAAQAETKIQRKNAKKNEAKKAQREAEEADRVARLAQHRKGLERQVPSLFLSIALIRSISDGPIVGLIKVDGAPN